MNRYHDNYIKKVYSFEKFIAKLKWLAKEKLKSFNFINSKVFKEIMLI